MGEELEKGIKDAFGELLHLALSDGVCIHQNDLGMWRLQLVSWEERWIEVSGYDLQSCIEGLKRKRKEMIGEVKNRYRILAGAKKHGFDAEKLLKGDLFKYDNPDPGVDVSRQEKMEDPIDCKY